MAGLTAGLDGALYGAAQSGGPVYWYNGTIFKRTPDGAVTVAHEFDNTTEGRKPSARLLQMPDGTLWGAAVFGGRGGWGTVFSFDPVSKAFKVLHSFTGGSDGSAPSGELVRTREGLVYGTTNGSGSSNGGTIYSIDPVSGAYRQLYAFALNSTLGHAPAAGLAQGTDGALYGITSTGAGSSPGGSVYRFDITRNTVSLVHQLAASEGCAAKATLYPAHNGKLYGSAQYCGANGYGTLFSLALPGKFTVLRSFNYSDGANPFGGIAEASDGYLYGTTTAGGPGANGTAFRLLPDGSDFGLVMTSGVPGETSNYPQGTLVLQGNALWGTSAAGGSIRQGTIFSLTPAP